MQTPPPPNTQNKMATTIQGTGVKMINNQFNVQMKLPSSTMSNQSTVSNSSSIKGIDINRKIRSDND